MNREGDIAKLPKWAKRHIETLEMNLEEMQRREHQILGVEETNVVIDGFHKPDILLPKDSHISFIFENTKVSVYKKNNHLNVNAGGSSVRVLPRASNCFEVELEDD